MKGVKQKTDRLACYRMQVIDCTNTSLGYFDNCGKPSCKNPMRLCDGSFNYEYISQLVISNAACSSGVREGGKGRLGGCETEMAPPSRGLSVAPLLLGVQCIIYLEADVRRRVRMLFLHE